PRHFASWRDFSSYCRVMYDCSSINATKDLHWDIRPRPMMGTIEFRMCDVPPTFNELLGLVALMRSLTVATLHLLQQEPRLRRASPRWFRVAHENKWRAARYGLRAQCVRTPGSKRLALADDTSQLLEHLLPVAEEKGDASFLAALPLAAQCESGAER